MPTSLHTEQTIKTKTTKTKRTKTTTAKTPRTPTLPELPKGIERADLEPNHNARTRMTSKQHEEFRVLTGGYSTSISLWYVEGEEWGWVMPTLTINQSRRSGSHRTYGVKVKNGKLVTVGHGPHVLHQVRIYVNRSNFKRVMPFLKMYQQGMADAQTVRDRISTRRAQGALYRRWF